MEQKISTMNCYFEEHIRQCEQRSKELSADGRADEATFEKVKANIFDIFRTVFSVATEHCKGDSEEIRSFFTLRLEQIPTSWAVSYHKAQEHNDTAKMLLEQLKLDTVEEIKKAFTRVWEGAL